MDFCVCAAQTEGVISKANIYASIRKKRIDQATRMKGPNNRSVTLNRATVAISQTIYDRRAIDCTDDKALVNSLNHLTYLTSSSTKVREAMIHDGAVERLVSILYECKDPKNNTESIMLAWKWVLALQCLVLIGTRGNEKMRKKLVDAGIIPILTTILDNYYHNMNLLNTKNNLSNQIISPNSPDFVHTNTPNFNNQHSLNNSNNNNNTTAATPVSASTNTNNSEMDTNHLDDQQNIERRNNIINQDLNPIMDDMDEYNDNDQDQINRDETNNVIITDDDQNISDVLRQVRTVVDDTSDTILNAENEIEKLLKNNIDRRNNDDCINTNRILCEEELELLTIVELIKCIQKLSDYECDSKNEISSLFNSNFKYVLNDSILSHELTNRIELSNLLSNSDFSNDIYSRAHNPAPRTFENGLIVPLQDDVIWSLQLLAFISKYTYLRHSLSSTHIINGLSVRKSNSPPPLEQDIISLNELDDIISDQQSFGIDLDSQPIINDNNTNNNNNDNINTINNNSSNNHNHIHNHNQPHNPTNQLLFSNDFINLNDSNQTFFDKKLNEQNQRLQTLKNLTDENDKGIVDDYFNILKTDSQLEKMKFLEKVRLNSVRLKHESLGKLKFKNKLIHEKRVKDYSKTWDYYESWDEFEKTVEESPIIDEDLKPLILLNLFPLIERFTVKQCFSSDINYWAGVVVRNANRRDEKMGGKRQCGNFYCGKWEDYPKQFSKCRRCKRTKYCSRECQTKAWTFHKHWCVPVNQSPNESSSSAHNHIHSTTQPQMGNAHNNDNNRETPREEFIGHVEEIIPRRAFNRNVTAVTADESSNIDADTSVSTNGPPTVPATAVSTDDVPTENDANAVDADGDVIDIDG